MKEYTVTLTESEMAYIRSALCDKNLKHTLKKIRCRDCGDTDGYDFQSLMHSVGQDLLKKIDILQGLAD